VTKPEAPTRVAIVGGGPAALAAAFELTSDDRADRYQVTIFQQGWRPGGKCAAGRSPIEGDGERIEEHGLHVFFGCYANTRIVVDRCLQELRDGPDPYAFQSFDDAFEAVDHIVLGQSADRGWDFVELEFPRNPRAPANFGDFVADALRWATGRLRHLLLREGLAGAPVHEERWSAAAPILHEVDRDEPDPGSRIDQVTRAMSRLQRALTSLFMDVEAAARGPEKAVEQLRDLVRAVLPDRPQASPDVRFFLDTVDILRAVLRGVWQSTALDGGFDALNDVDLAAWLQDHGLELADDPHEWPALLRAVYDGCFAFVSGDPEQPSMAAGRALQGAIRCLFHYEGSVLYRPRSSMSDAVIGPLARVLRQRGVDIRYFHAVEQVRVTEDGRHIAGLDVIQQVPTRPGARVTSEPQFERDGEGAGTLETWPSVPPLDVLPARARIAPTLLEQEINPFGGRRIVIDAADPEHGFDQLILAVPPDVQCEICGPLMAADPNYARMLGESNSVVTQAAQIWLDRTASELGQQFTSASLLSCFVEPLDTYADMAHLIEAERWPPAIGVQHVAYFCGVLPDAGLDNQEQADMAVRAEVQRFLNEDAPAFWPDAAHLQGFNWDTLVPRGDPPTDPPDRIYSRANFASTERYVLTLPRTVGQRLSARGTGFDNLVLAGDWTANGLDAGCLEAAVTSGRLAAQAIAGTPAIDEIPGVTGPPGFPNIIERPPDDGRHSPFIDRVASLRGAFLGLAGGAVKLVGVAVDAVPDGLMRRIPGAARLRRRRRG
jgi:uncharacterized protein with NAD-binding domain and iron-sulfur cluster